MNAKNKTQKEKVFVLDASAIFNGILAQNLDGRKFVTECVIFEIQGMLRGEVLLEKISLSTDIIQTNPAQKSIRFIQKIASETGDIDELSSCDIEIISLAHELKKNNENVILITDDYDIQNLANSLQINFRGIYWKGIAYIHDYYWLCIGCGAKSKEKQEICIECGSEMKKKTIRRKKRN